MWSSGGGDALPPEDIEAAFRADLREMSGDKWERAAWRFCCGVDLGLVRDSSACIVLAVGKPRTADGGRIRLATAKLWRPLPGRKVELQDVEDHIREMDTTYNLEAVAFDPWQCEHLAQRIEADHRRRSGRHLGYTRPFMREMPPSGTNLRQQATLLIESFQDRRLMLFPCDALRDDLHKARIEEKSYGFRVTSPRDGSGHGDTLSAFSIALVCAHEYSGKGGSKIGAFDPFDARNPLAAAYARLQADQERYAMEQASAADDHDDFRWADKTVTHHDLFGSL